MSYPRPNQHTGPLAGHVRTGRTYSPPLSATGVFALADWVRDDLPDLLWPTLVLSELGTASGRRFVSWQKAVLQDLSEHAEPDLIADCLDGRFTGLDRLADRTPDAKDIVRRRAREHGLLPTPVARVIGSYPARPADWLVDDDPASIDDAGLRLLASALVEVLRDGHREAVIKCLGIWSAVQAGTFRSSGDMIDLLKTYPTDPSTRGRADTAVRAAWGARKGMLLYHDENHFEASIQWARSFWTTNSMTSRCVRHRSEEIADDVEASTDSGDAPPEPTPMPDSGSHLRRAAIDLLSSYVQALETAPMNLYDRERQEVHSGLVARAGRDVITALGIPDLWCMEHGAHIVRVLVEARIYLQWMAQQEPSIYKAFQDYGAGKAKLYARIVDEVPEEARQQGFVEAVEELERLSRNGGIIDYRTVDTRDSFAEGKSIRAMAQECGLIDLYRQAYYMASGVAHSEWWSVETHAMERCLNVMHGGHMIPSLSLNAGGNLDVATSWVDQFGALIRLSLRVLGTDANAVDNAFSWLDGSNEALGSTS